jgi:hypothetical protein
LILRDHVDGDAEDEYRDPALHHDGEEDAR